MAFAVTVLRLTAVALVATFTFAFDAAAQSQRLRGEVESVDGNALTVKTSDGKTVKVALDEKYTVSHAIPATLADLKPGTFIGVGALPEDGGLKAIQVQIFPPNTNARERHGDWSADPNGTMTNAPVAAVVTGQADNMLVLAIQDKKYEIKVGPDTPIIRTVRGDKDLVKKGAWIGISNATEKNGVFSTRQILVSDDRRYPAR